MYVSSKEAQAFYKVSGQTLRRWADNRRIKTIITDGGHRRFLLIQENDHKPQQKSYIYARVSSKKPWDGFYMAIKQKTVHVDEKHINPS